MRHDLCARHTGRVFCAFYIAQKARGGAPQKQRSPGKETKFGYLNRLVIAFTGGAYRPERRVRLRGDRRDITLTWKPVKGAQGYNILWGIAPDKLYSSWMVYGDECRHLMKCLSTDQKYYFAIEAFNENGVSQISVVKEVK